MAGLQSFVAGLFGAVESAGCVGAGMLADRLELAALELREAKIRLVQVLLLACLGAALSMFGLGLAIVAAVYALPPEWRLRAIGGMAGLGLLGGLAVFLALRRRISGLSLAFSQSLAELKKDKACF